MSRKQKGSKSRAKAKTKLARLHARIANIRQDELHKLASFLASRYSTLVMEDLNVIRPEVDVSELWRDA